ncbi:MAG TPA: hypothetical protein VHC95_13150 [Opitutales bacterium]|nr:hypothetical protein [Opitutales bacterium]
MSIQAAMFAVEKPWLLLDASGVTARTGVWQNSRWLGWQEGEAPALESLFAGTRAALAAAQTPWQELGGYLYVDGPGSVLGLRLAAMAIRAWQTDDAARSQGEARPVYSAGSLPLAAALALAAGEKPPFTLFTDAKQGFWQILEITTADPEKYCATAPREILEADLPAGTLFHLPARKAWHRAPERARTLPASLRDHPEILALPHLFRKVKTPTPYAVRAPEYKKWAGALA